MKTAGYSGTLLATKLGMKENSTIKLVNEPDYYRKLFTDYPGNMKVVADSRVKKDLIHYFTKSASKLNTEMKSLRREILENGMIWISWPKKSSKVETGLNENIVREIALQHGFVDVKVCAIDETWSGLKLVIRRRHRRL